MYPPFTIGATFRIVPPGTPASTEGRIDLVMDRGAFGSGEHETTASCLEILAELPEVRGARVLDLGSGTGILAFAALKLGAARAVCVDINPQAVETARRNGELNGLTDRLIHRAGTLGSAGEDPFDLVLANIYGDILLNLAEDLTRRARPGALLLLSGILWEYNFEVRQHYERLGCEIIRNRMLEQFSTVLLRKRKPGNHL
ncbi:50S ribosomal protein L11 methyltransferase [Desulfuromonas sp. TF]|uniref:50S ribosomal protein L11 methyltransferase n=1 Tax=Desulfuromonas sp. TF TaxID=1232410 RepID=UPI00040489B3|nr:50S ribosomal protein L11 methyltransferase [Desulfuromonas sp. TF]